MVFVRRAGPSRRDLAVGAFGAILEEPGPWHRDPVSLRGAIAEGTGETDPLAFSFLDMPDVPPLFLEERLDAPWRYEEWRSQSSARVAAELARRKRGSWSMSLW